MMDSKYFRNGLVTLPRLISSNYCLLEIITLPSFLGVLPQLLLAEPLAPLADNQLIMWIWLAAPATYPLNSGGSGEARLHFFTHRFSCVNVYQEILLFPGWMTSVVSAGTDLKRGAEQTHTLTVTRRSWSVVLGWCDGNEGERKEKEFGSAVAQLKLGLI